MIGTIDSDTLSSEMITPSYSICVERRRKKKQEEEEEERYNRFDSIRIRRGSKRVIIIIMEADDHESISLKKSCRVSQALYLTNKYDNNVYVQKK